jgi:predicted RNase H-like HicB family nuclease
MPKKPVIPPDARKYFQQAGAAGGKTRAEHLTDAELSAIGKKGAAARWGKGERAREGVTRLYAVVFESSGTGYRAYAPDVPGCTATGSTLGVARVKMRRALTAHLRAILKEGGSIPDVRHVGETLKVQI